ncbi:MAG: hypothetical protein HQ582_20250 [Planctomycetes bacterium]|nr:hypothetical protein [Planctomycetota bacterium]
MTTPAPTTDATSYTVVLKPLSDATDPRGTRRLRSGLKTLLRRFCLRCVTCEPAAPDMEN